MSVSSASATTADFRRRGISFLVLFCLLLLPLLAEASPIRAKSAILYDLDRRVVLYEQNADIRIPPASLTKIMTMYVALDAVRHGQTSLKRMVKVSKRAAAEGGSRMGLKAGDKLSLNKLLYGMAVSSGNDASWAVAEHIGGTVPRFIRNMNRVARKLGMKNTVFKTPNGLPAAGQYTTARDMLHLARNYIAVFPHVLRYHSVKTLTWHGHKTRSNNPLLGSYKGADGLKTGWTTASGYNIIATARRGNTRLIAVILGASSPEIRAQEIRRLMDAAFALRKGQTKSIASYLGVKHQRGSRR